MLVIFGLIIVVATVVIGAAGVLGNDDGAHGVAHGFSVLGYHVNGSGTVFLYGIAVGAVGLFGVWLLLAGARRTARRGSAARRGLRQSRRETAESRQETAAVSKDRDDLIGQRDTARADTASALASPTPGSRLGPSADQSHQVSPNKRGRIRPRLSGRWDAAASQAGTPRAASADPEPLAAQAPADAPATADDSRKISQQ
jgi:hypothetical protein